MLPAIIRSENQVNIIYITDNIGKKYIPAYTDWENFKCNGSEMKNQAIVFGMKDYCKIIQSDSSIYGIAINPYSHNLIVKRENVIWYQKENIGQGERIAVGIPKDYPNDMVEELKTFFSKKGTISKAYLLWMVRNSEASYLLILDTEEKDTSLISEVSIKCQSFLGEKALDILVLESSFSKEAIENQKPFYENVNK